MTKKILIADSDPLFLETIATQIKDNRGYEVITAFDGMEALKKARRENPDIIILEDTLVFIDGFKLCRFLKFDKQRRHIPIILLTPHISDANVALAKEVGSDDYLLHSVNDNLLEKIDSYLSKTD
ncbi:MAG: response regulator [Candidatus Omnitrophica bacterium]|nr:response regulator [Candidatus Omnitrophota bacterium]MBU1933109.1 response regulator [Candidatus Omnitrophota bacterium]